MQTDVIVPQRIWALNYLLRSDLQFVSPRRDRITPPQMSRWMIDYFVIVLDGVDNESRTR